ncbi:Outer membrane protein IcsA autotransporter precursor [Budvicia aquatica]|nr:Outer membrane protein IcsA autotransporter precursor [Budvicia aquatica]
MAGYANNSSRTHSDVSRYSSTGKVDGYSVGLYGTWYANNADKTGIYVDTWALYNWFNNQVQGEQLHMEDYKSDGVTASIESGYSFKVGESERTSYWLQPKAQVIWMGVSANDYTETNGTRVKDDTNNNLMTRLGLRAYANGHSQIDDGKDREFQPFVEVNWIHNTENYTVIMNDVKNSQVGAKDIGELKLGIEGKLSNNVSTWANVAQQWGTDSYTDTQGMFGVKYSF